MKCKAGLRTFFLWCCQGRLLHMKQAAVVTNVLLRKEGEVDFGCFI